MLIEIFLVELVFFYFNENNVFNNVLTTLGSTSVSATPGFTCHYSWHSAKSNYFWVLDSIGCPVSFGPIWASGPKVKKNSQIFTQGTSVPDIHPRNKCTKFQPNPTNFWVMGSVGCPKFFRHTDR